MASQEQLFSEASNPVWFYNDSYVLYLKNNDLWAGALEGDIIRLTDDGVSRNVTSWIVEEN